MIDKSVRSENLRGLKYVDKSQGGDVNNTLVVKMLGRQDYLPIWQAMQTFTNERNVTTADELWVVEHNPVYTQGQAGKAEHLLCLGDIPLVQSDRGGQVTYHGPGQLVIYFLLDIRRLALSTRELVSLLEKTSINTLANYGIEAQARADAPGVYVNNKKICSLGLRIRKGCSFHGLALNVAMDLSPFRSINPCGYAGMEMTQVSALGGPSDSEQIAQDFIHLLTQAIGYQQVDYSTKSVQL